jgi:hypothetical protein
MKTRGTGGKEITDRSDPEGELESANVARFRHAEPLYRNALKLLWPRCRIDILAAIQVRTRAQGAAMTAVVCWDLNGDRPN